MPPLQKFTIISVSFFILVILGLTWSIDISLEKQAIPTTINGITSSISLIVGFTLTASTILITKSSQFLQKKALIAFSFATLFLSIIIIFCAYVQLMEAKYQVALRFAMTGLISSVFVLFIFFSSIGGELGRLGEEELAKTKTQKQ